MSCHQATHCSTKAHDVRLDSHQGHQVKQVQDLQRRRSDRTRCLGHQMLWSFNGNRGKTCVPSTPLPPKKLAMNIFSVRTVSLIIWELGITCIEIYSMEGNISTLHHTLKQHKAVEHLSWLGCLRPLLQLLACTQGCVEADNVRQDLSHCHNELWGQWEKKRLLGNYK